MIPFKDITLADRDTITAFTMKSDRRNCDLHFPTSVAGDSCTILNLQSSTIFWYSNFGPANNWHI